MLGGIILILAGILIAVFPHLLSIIVASLLIVSGALTLLVAYQNKKLVRQYNNPVVKVFFRI